jgi:hypothetical protein
MQNLVSEVPDSVCPNDVVIAKNMADLLHKHFPGHLWGVQCRGDQGVAMVWNLSLSGQWGFVIKLGDVFSATDMDKKVLMAGGEVLERYKVKRGRADPEELRYLPTDFAGRHVALK